MADVKLFLDVDGVLNAVDFRFPDAWPENTWRSGEADGGNGAFYTIRWSTEVVDAVIRWHECPDVEVVWLTTWGDQANVAISPLLGLPTFPVAARPPFRERGGWWKFAAVKDWYGDNNGAPFVWVDDDLGRWDDGASDWLSKLNARFDSPVALGVSPATNVGISPGLVSQIDEFLAGHVG